LCILKNIELTFGSFDFDWMTINEWLRRFVEHNNFKFYHVWQSSYHKTIVLLIYLFFVCVMIHKLIKLFVGNEKRFQPKINLQVRVLKDITLLQPIFYSFLTKPIFYSYHSNSIEIIFSSGIRVGESSNY